MSTPPSRETPVATDPLSLGSISVSFLLRPPKQLLSKSDSPRCFKASARTSQISGSAGAGAGRRFIKVKT